MKAIVLKIANLLGETGLYHRLCPEKIPVFILHRVHDDTNPDTGGMHANRLRQHLRYLADRNYQVLGMDSIRQIVAKKSPVPPKSVAFTIDDGFLDHYQVAASVFDEFGFPLNFFIISGFLDEQLWPWDDQVAWSVKYATNSSINLKLPDNQRLDLELQGQSTTNTVSHLRESLKTIRQADIYEWIRTVLFPATGAEYPETVPPEYSPMTWDDARDLVRRGHGVFPHTCSHRILSALQDDERESEIKTSRERVEDEIETDSSIFAYPTGRRTDYGDADIRILNNAGFSLAFTAIPDYIKPGGSRFELPRFSLPESPDDFCQIVNRFEALKARFRP